MNHLLEIGYKNVQHDMEDCHANYYTATYGSQTLEVKITHDDDEQQVFEREPECEDWQYVGTI